MFALLRSLPTRTPLLTRGATKKAKGSSKNGRDSAGRRLGAKVSDGEYVQTGNILVRQRGTRMHPGIDVGCGRDHTLYALADGLTKFVKSSRTRRVFVHVVPVPKHREPSVERWHRAWFVRNGCRGNGIPVGLHAPR